MRVLRKEIGTLFTVLAILAVIMLCVGTYVTIDIMGYRVQEVEKTEDAPKLEEAAYYEVANVSEELLGKNIVVLGYMCNEVGTDTSAAWLVSNPFRSKDEAHGELRIDTGLIIEYTPMAVAVHGRLEKIPENMIDDDEFGYKLKASNIYIYSGDIERYESFNKVISEGIFDSFMEVFAAEGLNEDNKSNFESALEKCTELEELELVDIGNKIIAGEVNIEELYNDFRVHMICR